MTRASSLVLNLDVVHSYSEDFGEKKSEVVMWRENSDIFMRSLTRQSRSGGNEIAGLTYMVCILTRRHVWAKNSSHSSSLETGFIGRQALILCFLSYLILRASW